MQACRVLAVLDEMLKPADHAIVAGWLKGVAAAVRIAPTKEEFAARAALLVQTELPRCAFTQSSLRLVGVAVADGPIAKLGMKLFGCNRGWRQ